MADQASAPAAIEPFPTDGPPPAIPGFLLRHLRAPDDYGPMNDLANAVRAAEGDSFYTTVGQFQAYYDNLPDSDPAHDVAVAEIDGRIIGYGRAGWHEELDGTRIYEVIPFIDASDVGPEIFMAMVGAIEARLRAIAADHPPGEKLYDTFGSGDDALRDELLRAAGYEPVRFFYSMVRPSVDDLPNAPLPDGIEIRDVTPEHLPAIWAGADEAFRDNWGYRAATDNDYQVFLTDPVLSDSSLWRVGWDGDQVAGQVRGYINAEENERFGRKRGYTEFISVRRPWRRRGLARALIAATFPLFRARGMTEAALGVDVDNTSGALRVYESCGFRPVSRSSTYRKPLA